MKMSEQRVASKTFGGYIILHTIGKGEFGKVKLAYDPNKDLEVAIKFIKRSNITSPQKQAKLEREINILQNLNHPHIVRLYDVIETEKYIGIVMAYANGGELFEYISDNQYLSEEESAKFFIQLLDGVQYLHSRHIVHRDLKLENLLLDQKGDIVITDFGFANNSRKNPSGLLSTSCGSPCYAAPELVINDNYVGEAADIWSCGIILYAMLCGYLPFDDDPNNPDGENLDLLYKYILESQLTFPEYVSEDAQDLVCGMLIPDPEKRWPMEKVINHRWLRNSQYAKEKMNEAMNMKLDYIYDDSYVKYMNESTSSEMEKEDAKVPDFPPQVPEGTHSRQVGLDDETEHTEVYENRVNVSVNENVDTSMDKTEYIPNQEVKIVEEPAVPKVENEQSQTSSSQEYMDAQQDIPMEVEQAQEELMEVEEVVAPKEEDKMEVDEPTATTETTTEDPNVIEEERQNAEKQIEKLISEIQQEQFTQLEEMKDQLQEVVKDENSEPVEEQIEAAAPAPIEAPIEIKEEISIPSPAEVPIEQAKEEIVIEQPIEVPEVKEEVTVPEVKEEVTVPEVKEEVAAVSEVAEEVKEEVAIPETVEVKEQVAEIPEAVEEVKEEVTEKVEEVKEEAVVVPETEEVKEQESEKVDSPNTIKLEKEDNIEVDEVIPHSGSTSSSSSSSSEESKKNEEKVDEEKEEKENAMEVVKPEEAEAKDTTLTEADIKKQDSTNTTNTKDSEITTSEEKEMLKKKKKGKKIGKKGKEIKKKNKKNIKSKIKGTKMFKRFFGCVMKN